MKTPFLDSISKYSERSLWSDFSAGIDPTGTRTLQYGIEDVGDSKKKNDLRKAMGVAGGLLAGALIVPSTIYGVIKGGKGLTSSRGLLNKLRGGLTGFRKGFLRPYSDIYHGIRGRNYLKAIQSGKPVSGEASMRKLIKARFGMLPPDISGKLTGPGMTKNLQWLAQNKPEQYKKLLSEVSGSLGNILAFMGLGGAVNAASALAQYNLGQGMSRRISSDARSKLLGHGRITK